MSTGSQRAALRSVEGRSRPRQPLRPSALAAPSGHRCGCTGSELHPRGELLSLACGPVRKCGQVCEVAPTPHGRADKVRDEARVSFDAVEGARGPFTDCTFGSP
jgi:hypothetical protein